MKYCPKIDGLRFVAIVFVLIEHFAGGIGNMFSAGYYGVNLFFCVSGFLITAILLNTTSSFGVAYKNFIARRSLRIFPIYYLTVFILFFLQVDVIKQYLFYFLTYTYNYVLYNYQVTNNPVNHFWSLCFEEQFYIVWPILVLLLRKNKKLLVGISGAVLMFCLYQLTSKHLLGIINYKHIGLFSSIGFLTAGGLAAIFFNTNKIPLFIFSNKYIEYAIWFLLIVSLVTNLPTKYILLICCTVYIVLKSVQSNFHFSFVNKVLLNKKAIFIGTISYGIYIYHLPVVYYFEKYIFNPLWFKINFNQLGILKKLQWYSWLIKLPLYSAVSIFTAFISYKYIEQPILAFKEKYFKKD